MYLRVLVFNSSKIPDSITKQLIKYTNITKIVKQLYRIGGVHDKVQARKLYIFREFIFAIIPCLNQIAVLSFVLFHCQLL